ncbi:MAG: flagellar assembly peptidoglycan hydrolase FlgJ [Nitrococcus sp.]|nr:flagellar assembly peptidoglycan hydrolase FlgJ [Nitrococcus sp.]
MTVQNTTLYNHALDSRGLRRLHRELRNPSPESLGAVARQFEAVFVEMLIERMRATTPGNSLFGGHGVKQYRALLDRQLAAQLSQGPGIGLAAVLERELLAHSGLSKDAPPSPAAHSLAAYPRRLPAAPAPADSAAAAPATPAKAVSWDSPESFVRSIWPAAQRTAASLGVPPEALVAQAALETGWGEHVLRCPDGRTSFNLFNIKAHGGWSGETVRVPTLEYRDGIAVRESADFRVYDSLAQAFADYAELLRQPRYAEALNGAGDAATFLQGLQRAGYATDPAYADKILRIMDSDALRLGRGEFKKTDRGTNT